MAGTVRPSRIAGTKLNALAVRYYTLNEQGQIDRLILNDVTGDLWKYGVLDDVKNLAFNASSILGTLTGSGSSGSGDSSSGDSSSGSGSGSTGDGSSGSGSTGGTTNTTTVVDDLRSVLVPTTSEILWGVIDGSLLSTVWNRITSSSGSLLSIGLKQLANITGQPMSTILNFVAAALPTSATSTAVRPAFSTSIKYPVLAGGLAVRQNVNGTVKAMIQLMPMKIDQVGAASVISNGTRYETADDMQVYLWYKGQYYATKLSEVNSEGYYLTGWYDNFGCAAGKRVRVIVAVEKGLMDYYDPRRRALRAVRQLLYPRECPFCGRCWGCTRLPGLCSAAGNAASQAGHPAGPGAALYQQSGRCGCALPLQRLCAARHPERKVSGQAVAGCGDGQPSGTAGLWR